MKQETKKCQNCKGSFAIEPEDFGFYEKMHVPPPTFCPDCRRERRWAWRNNLSLYYRECKLCEKSVVSIYSPESDITVYCNKCWWSDKWDPKSYGREYDFSRGFFEQFSELMHSVPHMAVVNDDGIASVNCEYTHDWWFSKNCYMCFSGWHVQDVMYSFFILSGKEIMDCALNRTKSERIYECSISSQNYNCTFIHVGKNNIDSHFLYDCINCKSCFMCFNQQNKKYFYKNKEYSKEEYEKILATYKLDTFSGLEKAKKEFEEFKTQAIRRYLLLFRSKNSVGDFLSDSKNCKYIYVGKSCENSAFCEFVGDASGPIKDCYDVTMTGGASECYESLTADHSQLNLFCVLSPKNQDVRYTQHCHSSKHLFGCVGIRNGRNCIFNKEYPKEEYEKLVAKITEQMKQNGEYGEFYPAQMSPFGYNESCAMEEFPLTRDEAIAKGYKWADNMQRTEGKETMPSAEIPESIHDVKNTILNEILACENCKRNYKIVENELIFYRKMVIPIPRKCFHCRHATRMARSNPFKLWHRQCMCGSTASPQATGDHGHTDRCSVEFETTYAPERPEIVYCEKCYQKEIF